GQDEKRPLFRAPDALAPEGCLADARLALEHEHGEALARRLEEFLGERELPLAPDDVRHAPTLLHSFTKVKVGAAGSRGRSRPVLCASLSEAVAAVGGPTPRT